MRRLLLAAFGLALLPAMAQARNCAEVLALGVPLQEAVAGGSSSSQTFVWRVTARNLTPTRQMMQIWVIGIPNLGNPVNAATRHHLPPFGQMMITLGQTSGAQPTVDQMRAAIRTTCEG
ncbi:hypothetical protein KTR66_21170 [Roseococcus sp. SDR]|uniref:hypothetical protein n=1 Tax=Roseococcus sp. SDR TaxID=2835532 RepID=UPI001BCBC3FA|nr:hypothetical protein [Roseococcus sp. SDR]MBS7792517.1 hypothetical protein [Roseococcus sp. SDR]MBV1847831.1 hypothetical protein [Roseococcus sp. SDR]